MTSFAPFRRSLADRLAVGLSGLCIAHCLVLPLLMTFYSSSLLLLIGDEIFHSMIVLIAIPISCFALLVGCKSHKNFMAPVLGAAGLLLLIASATLLHDLWGGSAEVAATILGSLALATSHVINFRLCSEADSCACSE